MAIFTYKLPGCLSWIKIREIDAGQYKIVFVAFSNFLVKSQYISFHLCSHFNKFDNIFEHQATRLFWQKSRVRVTLARCF